VTIPRDVCRACLLLHRPGASDRFLVNFAQKRERGEGEELSQRSVGEEMQGAMPFAATPVTKRIGIKLALFPSLSLSLSLSLSPSLSFVRGDNPPFRVHAPNNTDTFRARARTYARAFHGEQLVYPHAEAGAMSKPEVCFARTTGVNGTRVKTRVRRAHCELNALRKVAGRRFKSIENRWFTADRRSWRRERKRRRETERETAFSIVDEKSVPAGRLPSTHPESAVPNTSKRSNEGTANSVRG